MYLLVYRVYTFWYIGYVPFGIYGIFLKSCFYNPLKKIFFKKVCRLKINIYICARLFKTNIQY